MSGRYGKLALDAQIEMRPKTTQARGGRNRIAGYSVLVDGREVGQLQRREGEPDFEFVGPRGKSAGGFRGSPRQFQSWMKQQMAGAKVKPRAPKKSEMKPTSVTARRPKTDYEKLAGRGDPNYHSGWSDRDLRDYAGDKWSDAARAKAAESRKRNAGSHPKPEGTRFSHLRAPAPRPGRKRK